MKSMAKSGSVPSLFVLAAAWLLLAASPARCEFINPPVLHDTLTIRHYDPAYGWSSFAARGSAFWKNVVYISGWPSDRIDDPIYAIDVSDPDHLVYIARSGGAHAYYYNRVFPYEDKLFVAGWGDMLRTYDLANPGHAVYLGSYDRPCEPDPNDPDMPFCYFGWGVQVVGNRAYISEASEKTNGIYILDVSHPARPTEISRMELDERVGGMAVRGSYLFFGYNHYGSVPTANYFSFRVANISDETEPRTLSVLNLTSVGAVGDIVLRGDIAYVSCGGLMAIDISDPGSPAVIGRCNTGSGQLLLLGDHAFIATGGNGCPFVNIADPENMHAVYTVYHGSPREYEDAVVGNGRYVYISTTANKLVEDPPYNVLHAFEVFDQDPDDQGPGTWSGISTGEAPWDTQYTADVLPSVAAPAWKLLEGSEAWASVANGVLRVNDTGTATGDKVKWGRNWDVTNTRGGTVLVRARCAWYDAGSPGITALANLLIEDGKYQEEFAFLSDRIRANRANLEAAVNGSAWHTYRITTQGGQFKVYVDEDETPALQGNLWATTSRARLTLGAFSSPARQEIWFDEISCCSSAAVDPGPPLSALAPNVEIHVAETAGKGSLSGIVPASAAVRWSTDGGATWMSTADQWEAAYEGNELPSASNPPWSAFEGTESLAAVNAGALCVADNSTASGSKIKWSRAWRADPSRGTTVLARIRCTAVGGDATYRDNLVIADGVRSERFRFLPDRIQAMDSGLAYLLDASSWHTYRITTVGASFSLYVDEQPTAAITGTMASPTSENRIWFGSGASAGTQTICFDYLRYNAHAALSPGQGDGGAPVTVTCSGSTGIDRATVNAYAVPFNRYSAVDNKLQFTLKDVAGNVGFSPIYTVRIGRLAESDGDDDGDVDQTDFGFLQTCLSGSGVAIRIGCERADFDADNDVDGADVQLFIGCMSGAGVQAHEDCAN
jgi:hypothetical protein